MHAFAYRQVDNNKSHGGGPDQDARPGLKWRGAVSASWVLMLVFAVGGFAGILLTALIVMAGAGAEREEPQDLSD